MFDYAMNGGTASEDFGFAKHAGTIMATYERPYFDHRMPVYAINHV